MKPFLFLLLGFAAVVFPVPARAEPSVVSTELIGPFTGADAKLHPGNQAPLPIEYYGTDLGFSYEHGGQIHFLFGDTWATEAYAPIEASTGPRQDDGFGTVDLAAWSDPATMRRIVPDRYPWPFQRNPGRPGTSPSAWSYPPEDRPEEPAHWV